MSKPNFDELITGKSSSATVLAEPVEAEQVDMAEPETEDFVEPVELTVDSPVEEPDYALYYYQGTPKNFSAASLWFAFAYTLLVWPLLWIAQGTVTVANNFGVSLPKFELISFLAVTVIGVIAVLCAFIGFFTAKKKNQSFIPGIWAILLTGLSAAGCYVVFVSNLLTP